MKKLRTKLRTYSAVFFAVLTIAITSLVLHEWKQQGCGLESLIAAFVFFSGITAMFGWVADLHIRELTRFE